MAVHTKELCVVTGILLLALALLILPLLSTELPQDCIDRAPCVQCVGKGANQTCFDGMCDAQGECRIPSPGTYLKNIPSGVQVVE